MSDPIPALIRAELDQTPAWWDREYDRLVKKQIPRDPEYHRGHDVEEPIAFYASGYEIQPRCLDCGVTIATTQ